MADQRLITLYPVDATPKDVVLRELPVADLRSETIISLRAVAAPPTDVVLYPDGYTASGTTAYTLTGQAKALTLTGQSATLTVGRTLVGETGALVLDGQTAELTVTSPSIAYELLGESGSIALTGQSAELTIGEAREIGGGGSWRRKRKKDGEDSLVNSHHDDLWTAADALAPVLGTRTARQDAERQLVGVAAEPETHTASNTAPTLSPQLAAMFALALDFLDE